MTVLIILARSDGSECTIFVDAQFVLLLKGDSGGPVLLYDVWGEEFQVGIVSYARFCGKRGWPGVATLVPPNRRWIDSVISQTG